MITDGELPHGTLGEWAISIAGLRPWKCGHMIVSADHRGYRALCGVDAPLRIWNGQNSLFGVGSFPKCKRCNSALKRDGKP